MHGDLNIEEIKADGKISDLLYTPVPGGIGRVTTSILLRNIIKAAGRAADDKRAKRDGIMSLMEMM